ncbi:MAG: CopG family transcriptional regulator [Chloroflexota bacterium]
MAETMVRKQVYLAPRQNRKLKALAALRHCTEAEVIRDAVDHLPDPEGGLVERLAAAGLLAPKPDDPTLPRGQEAEALEAEYEAWLTTRSEPLGLTEALLAERDEGR